MSSHDAEKLVPGGVPKVALLVTALCLFGVVAAVVTALSLSGRLDARSTPLVVTLVGFVVTTVPALLGATYSERASRDIRNGVVVDRARVGAAQAIREEQVITNTNDAAMTERAREGAAQAIRDEQVITRTGPVVTAEVAALTELVRATRANTDALRQVTGTPDRRAGEPPAAPLPEEGTG